MVGTDRTGFGRILVVRCFKIDIYIAVVTNELLVGVFFFHFFFLW